MPFINSYVVDILIRVENAGGTFRKAVLSNCL